MTWRITAAGLFVVSACGRFGFHDAADATRDGIGLDTDVLDARAFDAAGESAPIITTQTCDLPIVLDVQTALANQVIAAAVTDVLYIAWLDPSGSVRVDQISGDSSGYTANPSGTLLAGTAAPIAIAHRGDHQLVVAASSSAAQLCAFDDTFVAQPAQSLPIGVGSSHALVATPVATPAYLDTGISPVVPHPTQLDMVDATGVPAPPTALGPTSDGASLLALDSDIAVLISGLGDTCIASVIAPDGTTVSSTSWIQSTCVELTGAHAPGHAEFLLAWIDESGASPMLSVAIATEGIAAGVPITLPATSPDQPRVVAVADGYDLIYLESGVLTSYHLGFDGTASPVRNIGISVTSSAFDLVASGGAPAVVWMEAGGLMRLVVPCE